jgi:predicted DNA-binding transcriptional regulator AlpA
MRDEKPRIDAAAKTLLTSRELATQLSISEGTLQLWRSRGTGPRYVTLTGDRVVRYVPADVAAWIAARHPAQKR